MKRAAIATLGCKVNTFESELIMQRLCNDKYQRVDQTEVADVYIINSCTVTAEADRQSRQLARKLKRLNIEATVVMTGCYAQNNPETVSAIPEVDWVVGNAAKLDIADVILKHDAKPEFERTIIAPEFDETLTIPSDLLGGFESHSRAFIQIQQGCDQGCTFCIIHVARGPSTSFPISTVVEQYKRLVEQGFKEIVICGVDLGSYGEDLPEELSLTALLRALLALNLDCRIRISSIDPYHISDELVELMAANEQICNHIHLSMQSANTLILKRMKRRAGQALLFERVAALHTAIPSLVLSADVLVGFPTETPEQFSDTLNAIEHLNIAYPHVFPYSNREGTPAAKIPKQVDKMEIKRRAKLVRALGQKVWNSQAHSMISTQQRTIIEASHDDYYVGRCDGYFPVKVPKLASKLEKGQWCNVNITGVIDQSLLGELAISA